MISQTSLVWNMVCHLLIEFCHEIVDFHLTRFLELDRFVYWIFFKNKSK